MKFTKMHGAGNDFIIINNIEEKLSVDIMPDVAKKLCAQRTSVGADGLMCIVPAKKGGDYSMLFYNSDGSMGEMCGNGARCICRWGYENGLAGERQTVETTAGIVTGQRIDKRNYRIRLNDPGVIDLHRMCSVDGREYDCAYVELGDPGLPHAIVRFDGWPQMGLDALRPVGKSLRSDKAFPKGANVSFVSMRNETEVDIITFERGVEDFTLACGTGCGSTCAALTLLGLVASGTELLLHAPGGDLRVRLTAEGNSVRDIFLTGPTNIVCIGEITDEDMIC